MTADRSISESHIFSTANLSETQNGKWRSIGELAASLKAEVDRAIAAGDETAAADAHDALIVAEHCERVAATVRRFAR